MNHRRIFLFVLFFSFLLFSKAIGEVSLLGPWITEQGYSFRADYDQSDLPYGAKLQFEIFDRNLGIRNLITPATGNSLILGRNFDLDNFNVSAVISQDSLKGVSGQIAKNICSGYTLCTESARDLGGGKFRLSASIAKNLPIESIASFGFAYKPKDSELEPKIIKNFSVPFSQRFFSVDATNLLSGREYEYWPVASIKNSGSWDFSDYYGPIASFKTSGKTQYSPEERFVIKANDPMVISVGKDLTYQLSGSLLGNFPRTKVRVGFKFWQKDLAEDVDIFSNDVPNSKSTSLNGDRYSLNVSSANLGVLTSRGLCYKAFLFDTERNILAQSNKACATFLNIPYYNIHDYPWCEIMTGGGGYTVIGCRHAATTMVIDYWYGSNSMVKKNWDTINSQKPDPVQCREMFLKYGLWGDLYSAGPMQESLWTKLNISAIHVGPASAQTIKQVYTDNGVPVIILCRPSLNTCRFWDPGSQHQLVLVGYKNFNSYIKDGKKYLNQFYVNDNGYVNPDTNGSEGGKMRFVRFDDLLTGEKYNTNCNAGCGWQYPSPRSSYSAFEDEGIVALAPNNLKIKGDLFFYNTIAIKNNEITPWLIKVKAGNVINWLNLDDTWKSVNILQKGKNIAYSDIIKSGNYFSYKFSNPGEYTFELIGGANQKGRIAVVK